MHRTLIITLLAADRTGLVESLAKVVAAHEGNWVESSLARLAGRFAGVIRVDVVAERAAALEAALRDAAGESMHLIVESADDEPTRQATRKLRLELVGPDHPGIVRDVTHLLAMRRINVAKLRTRVESAPWSGEQLFHAEADLQAPADVNVDDLRHTLEHLAGELAVDIHLEDRGV